MADGSVYDEKPRDQAHEEKNLPEPSEFEKTPNPDDRTRTRGPQEAFDPRDLAEQASCCHDQDRDKQELHEKVLLLWLHPPDDRSQVDG